MTARLLKILHLLDHSLPLHSGYSFRSRGLLRTQSARGWDPVVLTSPKHEESWHGPWEEQQTIDGIRHYRTGTVRRSALPLLGELRLMGALHRRALQVARLERPDIVHAHSPVLNALPALLLRRRLHLPVVYEIRAFWEDAAAEHGSYSQGSVKYWLVRSLESWVCRRANQVVVLCQGLKQDLVKRGVGQDKLAVVLNGIDVHEFKPSAPDAELVRRWGLAGKTVIGFIGSFYRYEGLDLLVEAIARLSVARRDVVLLLAGGGPMEVELRGLIGRHGLEQTTILTGRVDHQCIPRIYDIVDVLAYPRYASRLTELVTPLKPLEAMAMGKPVVASDVGGHRELIGHGETGLLFRPGDVVELVRNLESLLENPELRRRLGEAGASWVRENHTWEKTTAPYVEAYARARAGRSKAGGN